MVVLLFTAADLQSRFTGGNPAALPFQPWFFVQPGDKKKPKKQRSFYDPGGEELSLERLLLGV